MKQNEKIIFKTETDFDGQFIFKDVVPGIYEVTVTITDYDTKNVTGFRVGAHMINFIDVSLDKVGPSNKKTKRKKE